MRIVIAEDSVLLREGLAMLPDAGGGPDVLPALLEHRPDDAVLDARLPPGFRDEGLRAAIEARRRITERSVSKHIGAVFAKLGLPPTGGGHRRVLAVLACLNA